jgi:hypothetical protein
VRQLLLGWYAIPESARGLDVCINPAGRAERSTPRIWNAGDGRRKLIMYVPREVAALSGSAAAERERRRWARAPQYVI